MQEINLLKKLTPTVSADYALDFEGVEGSKVFNNTGKKPIATTLINGGPFISTAKKVNGNSSGAFGTTGGDCLSLNLAAAQWTGDFTISAWVNQAGPGNPVYSGGYQMLVALNRVLVDMVYCFCIFEGKIAIKTVAANGTPGTILAGTTAVKSDVWEHIAFTRKNGILKLWLNGNLEATATAVWNIPLSSTSAFFVGNCYDGRVSGNGGYCGMNGYVDVFRIYGEALYDAPFVPPFN